MRDTKWLGASLYGADLRGTQLGHAQLAGVNLRRASFSSSTNLYDIVLQEPGYDEPRIRDIQWNGVDLTVVEWSKVKRLGDERVARQRKRYDPLNDYRNATRAYRQLATVLRAQGLNEDADRFAYRAQVLQRTVQRRQGKGLRWLGSLMLDLISGYGYRPLRSFIAYAVVILGFMGLYLLNSQFVAPHLAWNEALVLSMSSFHGRGFFTPSIGLGDTYAELAAAEAFVGLMIEITFIATFTQRFFSR